MNKKRYYPPGKDWILVEVVSITNLSAVVKTEWYGWPKDCFSVSPSLLEDVGRGPFVEAL